MDDFSLVQPFYTHPPTLAAIKQVAGGFDFSAQRRREIALILGDQNAAWGCGARTRKNLQALESGAVAIVTGQQVGLFSGPAYAVYKALTAMRVAEELAEAGIPAVPVFWMATEDHDLDEVRRVSWYEDGKLQRFELPSDGGARPVGQVRLGSVVEEMAAQASTLLSGPGSPAIARMLRESYQAEESYGSAFAKLFARLFAEQGLILLDPLDARLHRLAAPVYRKAAEDRDLLNEQLLQRGNELERAGFEAQVKVTSRSTLLFSVKNGERLAISADNGKFRCGDSSWTREEMLRMVDSEPEAFSPNALFRPVVQDYLLPTAAYLGGPAEIAYYAQSEVLYRHVLGRMPVVLPRADFTLIDVKAERLLQQYGLCIENVWAGPQELRRKMESASLPAGLSQTFDADKAVLEKTLGRLGAQVLELDPTLGGAVGTARRKMAFQMEKLRRKTGRALDHKSGLVTAHQQFLEGLLYPGKALQSRELCFLPFLARWGMPGLAELKQLCSLHALQEHRIVRIP